MASHTLAYCNGFVPGVEFLGGLGVAVEFLTPLAALGLLVICSVALLTNSPTLRATNRSTRQIVSTIGLPFGNDVRIDAALFYCGRRRPSFRRSASEVLDWLSDNSPSRQAGHDHDINTQNSRSMGQNAGAESRCARPDLSQRCAKRPHCLRTRGWRGLCPRAL